ncbi:MAG TPA: DNA mismatch repair protein MutL [Firmicutes bacterium]|nr:DNA mismatch repair protein MutL [Bacillota bacterium]
MAQIEVVVAEIGSTTTVVNGFTDLEGARPSFLGQGQAPTSVAQGDVTIGLRQAVRTLEEKLGHSITWETMLATSSAAGGLRMSVHGLVYDMTARAAREAALGAGAVLGLITAGELQPHDLSALRRQNPNIILLAGGVDYGEAATVLANARHLAELKLPAPIIYAGNRAVQGEFVAIMEAAQLPYYTVDNVYPAIDELNVEPTRRVIQQVFEEHIVHAAGMEKIRQMVTGQILPTPGAVLLAAQLLHESIGDLLVIDVGGATTDVHSVTPGSEEINRLLLHPEPLAKRTVEGDLGVYVNAPHVAERIGSPVLAARIGQEVDSLLANWPPIPSTSAELHLLEELTSEAARIALERHAGRLKQLYGPHGRSTIAEGKDLSNVRFVIGTGGPLTQLANAKQLLAAILTRPAGQTLLPKGPVEILIDKHYNLAALGVLASRYPRAALHLMRESLGIS